MGGNEKDPLGVSFHVFFLDLNSFVFQSAFVIKWTTEKNLGEMFESPNTTNPRKLQGHMKQAVGEKYEGASFTVALKELNSNLHSCISF